jgi:hypothetical protein
LRKQKAFYFKNDTPFSLLSEFYLKFLQSNLVVSKIKNKILLFELHSRFYEMIHFPVKEITFK